jgi:hypothetical protein
VSKTNRERAVKARDRLVESEGYSEYSITLCPACNEPEYGEDDDPNEFVDVERTAWQISPADLVDSEHPNPWDQICVTPKQVEVEGGEEQLRVEPHKHDYSSEVYQDWQAMVDELTTVERRNEENQGLGDFA